MRAAACSMVGVAAALCLPLTSVAQTSEKTSEKVEIYGCDPEGWADAGVVLDLVKPDIGFAGVVLRWASKTPGYHVHRATVEAANEIARLVMAYDDEGQVVTKTFILSKTPEGTVELDQDPPSTFKFAKKVNGIPVPWRCEASVWKSKP